MKSFDNSRVAQAAFILYLLKIKKSISTFEARNKGICHPAGRIKELRSKGYQINTTWIVEHDTLGKPHRIARYYLAASSRRLV